MAPAKQGVTECYQFGTALSACVGGAKGVPNNITGRTKGALASVVTATGGIITATPVDQYKGIADTDTCILTPTENEPTTGEKYLSWEYSGGCVTENYVSKQA